MTLQVLGLNHTTAEIILRERFVLAEDQLLVFNQQLRTALGIDELVILSTCNRTEIYSVGGNSEKIIDILCDYAHVSQETLQAVCYVHHDEAAMRHLVEVACGLDSMMLGEPQVLGQVKNAYALAKTANSVAKTLHRVFQHVFHLSKKIRSETAIGKNPISVAFAAVRLASHVFSKLTHCHIIFVGAGETIELCARHFAERGAKTFIFVNRTLAHAKRLAQEFQAEAYSLSELPLVLAKADIIVTATESPKPLIETSTFKQHIVSTQYKPKLLLDLAVPRNIESSIGELDNCYLYSVDDLQNMVRDNLIKRQTQAQLAKEMIQLEVHQFWQQQAIMEDGQSIQELKNNLDHLVNDFLQELRLQGVSQENLKKAEKLAKRVQHQTLKSLRNVN